MPFPTTVLFGAASKPSAAPAPPSRPISLDGPVADKLVAWSRVAHHKSSSPQSWSTPHVLSSDAELFKVALGNVAGNSTPPYGNGPNNVTYVGSITIRGTTYPLTWSGSASVTVTPGQIVLSDALNQWDLEGSTIYVTIGATATGTVPTMEGYSDGTGAYITGPLAIIARSPNVNTKRKWLLFGDSTIEGVGDNQWGRGGQFGTGGYFARALDNSSNAYLNAAASGERWGQLDASTYTGRVGTLHTYANTAFVGYCINDILVTTAALLAESYLRSWLDLRVSKGLTKVYQATVLPRTSADGVTVSEIGTGSVERAAWNAWLLDGAPGYIFSGNGLWYYRPPGDAQSDTIRIGQTKNGTTHPLTAVIDVAGMVANPAQPKQWKSGFTDDGVHPNPTGHLFMANAITTLLTTI